MTTQVYYGLAVGDTLLSFDVSGSDENGAEVTLTEGDDNLWLVPSHTRAEAASTHNADWFNSSYDTPTNSYVGRCRVVRVTLNLEEMG